MTTTKFSLSRLCSLRSPMPKYSTQHSLVVYPKSGFFYSQALLLLIALTPLISATPACANPTPTKAAHMIDTQLYGTNTSHADASQTHTLSATQKSTPPTHISAPSKFNTKKHLYNLGKLSTIVYQALFAKEVLQYPEFDGDTPLLCLLIPTIISLANSIHDDYSSLHYEQKGETIATFDEIISKLRTTGKIINTIFFSIYLIAGIRQRCSADILLWYKPTRAIIAAISAAGFGESLYRDYKAYKQNKATKTKTDTKAITTAPMATQVPARI